MKRFLITMCNALICLCAVLSTTINARIVRSWTFASLAKEAEVLVIGEVVAVVTSGNVNEKNTHWNAPLLKKTATIRVIRTFPDPSADLPVGKQFDIDYLNLDPEKPTMLFDGPSFPELSPGQVRIFPIRKNNDKRWELPDEEDHDLLITAAAAVKDEPDAKAVAALIAQFASDDFEKRDRAQKELLAKGWPILKILKVEAGRAADAETQDRLAKIIAALGGNSGVEFLRAEYANALASTDARTRYGAAGWYGLKAEDAESVDKHLVRMFGDDAKAWMRVLVALFAETYSEKITLTQWATDKDADAVRYGGKRKLGALIWPRILKEQLDEQIITEACMNAPEDSASRLLAANKLTMDPRTNKLLLAALTKGQPDSITLAFRLSQERERTDPLAVAAVALGCKLMQSEQHVEYNRHEHDHLYMACQCICRWGEERDYRVLRDELKKSRTNNSGKFREIWRSLNWTNKRSMIPFCVVALDDQALSEWSDFRNCDMAVGALQQVTGEDFGMKEKLSIEDRNAAIEKARAWLAAHPPDF